MYGSSILQASVPPAIGSAYSRKSFIQPKPLCVRHHRHLIPRASGEGADRRQGAEQPAAPAAAEGFEVAQDRPAGAPQYEPQYYQGYYPYPGYPPPPPPARGGLPAYIWVAVGFGLYAVISKVRSFFGGGGPQQNMMSWAMQQMMDKQMKGAGSSGGMPPGFPDFSKMGAPPDFSAMGGAGFPSPPSQPAFDTTAKAVGGDRTGSSRAEASTSAAAGAPRSGSRFEELKSKERQRTRAKTAVFTDVDEEERGGSTSTNGSQPSTATTAEVLDGGAADDDGGVTMDLLEEMLRDPAMQELLYQHLPEPMRNKQTFDWMMSNPEYRKQLQAMLKEQGAGLDADVFRKMQGFNSEDVTKQLSELGMTPAEVVQRIMAEPELAQAFSKPQVQQAIMDLQSNPMSIVKYQDDKDVMLVFEKMSQMFPNAPGMAMPDAGAPTNP